MAMKLMVLAFVLCAATVAMGQSAGEKQTVLQAGQVTVYQLPQITVQLQQNLYLDPKLQPVATAKLEPIPTTWPNLKIEKIPTQWVGMKIVPVEGPAATKVKQKLK
jgi:hypothetical protein